MESSLVCVRKYADRRCVDENPPWFDLSWVDYTVFFNGQVGIDPSFFFLKKDNSWDIKGVQANLTSLIKGLSVSTIKFDFRCHSINKVVNLFESVWTRHRAPVINIPDKTTSANRAAIHLCTNRVKIFWPDFVNVYGCLFLPNRVYIMHAWYGTSQLPLKRFATYISL